MTNKILVKPDGGVELPIITSSTDFRLQSTVVKYFDISDDAIQHILQHGKDYVKYDFDTQSFSLIPSETTFTPINDESINTI